MYLPFRATACIFFGGVLKWFLDNRAAKKGVTNKGRVTVENIGLLLASGLIAGQAIMGIITAGLKGASLDLPQFMHIPWLAPWLALGVFAVLGFILIYFPYKKMVASGEFGKSEQENEN